MRYTMTDASCGLLGNFFSTFAHPTRMRILCALQHGPRTVTEIAAHAGIAIPNASQHLRMMRERGAVVAEKQAHHVFYRIADARILEALVLIRHALLEQLRENAARASENPAGGAIRKVFQPA
jgi:DNA-binding transcriptional ArsR family regulator